MRTRINVARKLAVIFILSVCFVGCFINVYNDLDVHDNTMDIGDACDVIQERFATDAGTDLDACREEDAGPCIRQAGEACTSDDECADICLCDICIDSSEFL